MNITEIRALSPHFSSSSGRVYHWLGRNKVPRKKYTGTEPAIKYEYDEMSVHQAMKDDPPTAHVGKKKEKAKKKTDDVFWIGAPAVARFLDIKPASVGAFHERHPAALPRKRATSKKGTPCWLYRSTALTPALKSLDEGLRVFGGHEIGTKKPPKNGEAKANAALVLGVRHLLETHKAGFLRQETFMAELEYLVNHKKGA